MTTATATETKIDILPGILRNLIGSVIHATDTESTRYALSAVLIRIDGYRIEAIATDGRRLVRRKIELPKPATDQPVEFLLPHKIARTYATLAKSASDFYLTVDTDRRIVSTGWKQRSKKNPTVDIIDGVDGRFPKVNDILERPDKIVGELSGKAETWESTIPESCMNKWELNLETGKIERRSYDLSKLNPHGSISIGFDCDYIQEWIRTVPDEFKVFAEFTGDDSAAYFHTIDDEFVMVLMPLAKD